MSHERDPFATRPIFLGLAALAVLLVLGWAIPTWLEVRLVEERERTLPPVNPLAEQYGRTVPPAPRLQVNPDRDIEMLRAAERARLESYGWVDRPGGIAHIPIERAMALFSSRRSPNGEPDAKENAPRTNAPRAPEGAT